MDELSGTEGDWESDGGSDDDTNIDAATTTTNESDSYSETVGAGTTTDGDDDESTDTDTTTDTDDDTPTNTEQSNESYRAAGMMVSGSSEDIDDDSTTTGDDDDDTDVDTPTDSLENIQQGAGDNGALVLNTVTTTSSETFSDSDAGTDSSSESTSQDMGLMGFITGGTVNSLETGSDTGSGDTTGNGDQTADDDESGDDGELDDIKVGDDGTQQSGSYTSSDDLDEFSTESESMSEDLGPGGAIAGGGSTQSSSESSDSTQTLINNGSDSDSLFDSSVDEEVGETDRATDSGDDSSTATDTAGMTWIDTLTENIGAEGLIAGGGESDSLIDSSGDTTTETDYPTVTATDTDAEPDLDSEVMMTLDESTTTTETDDEDDEDWATETLGTSAAIVGGSDCFTVVNLDTTDYETTGSGPEDGSDTTGLPDGTATEDGSGSSSDYVDQVFGDTLRKGGAIASGSMSYTVDASDSDELTKTEDGTESVAPELFWLTGSYSLDTTDTDDNTASETGTETLGEGGTISGGTASVSWSDGEAMSRDLEITGVDGSALNITESTTDSDGFAESGTETITAGGANAPSTLNFDWNQLGTDGYSADALGVASVYDWNGYAGSLAAYSTATDTTSSSWNDSGTDDLTDSDIPASQTDNYTWDTYDPTSDDQTYSLAGDDPAGFDFIVDSTDSTATLAQPGCETMSWSVGEGALELAGGWASYSENLSATTDTDDSEVSGPNLNTSEASSTLDGNGTISQMGTVTETSESYTADNFGDVSDAWGTVNGWGGGSFSYDNNVESDGGQGPSGPYVITLSEAAESGTVLSNTETFTSLSAFPWNDLDVYQSSQTMECVTTADSGGVYSTSGLTESDGTDTNTGEYTYPDGSVSDWSYMAEVIENAPGDLTTIISGSEPPGYAIPPLAFFGGPHGGGPTGGPLPYDSPGVVDVVPETANMTVNGVAIEAVDDWVSTDVAPLPIENLVALAAAGHDPADIMIPTQGSEGSGTGSSSGSGGSDSGSGGGHGDVVAAYGSGSAPASGSGILVSQGAISLPASTGGTTSGSTASSSTIDSASAGSTSEGTMTADSATATSSNSSGSARSSVSPATATGDAEMAEPAVEGGSGSSAAGSNLWPRWEGAKAFGASLWGNTGGALYNRFVSNGQKVGAAYGAVANAGSNVSMDIDLARSQREQLANQIANPNAQDAATEARVGGSQATNARNYGNFVQARIEEGEAVADGAVAGVEIALDTYMIIDGGIALKGAAGAMARGGGKVAVEAEAEALRVEMEVAESGARNAPSRPLGGRGPTSGREFDPAAAGGPIRQLTTGRIKITNQGIDVVEQHVGRFGPDAANQGMIQRLRDIAAGKLQPTQADLNYYSHELREFVRYRQLGWPTGNPADSDAAHELWNNAHTATLEDYGLREGPGVLYHPSVEP